MPDHTKQSPLGPECGDDRLWDLYVSSAVSGVAPRGPDAALRCAETAAAIADELLAQRALRLRGGRTLEERAARAKAAAHAKRKDEAIRLKRLRDEREP